MVARSAAQKAASLRNLARARAATKGRTSTRTASANDVTTSNRANVRYRKTRLRRVRIRL